MIPFLSGILAMGYFVAGLFFVRFWKQTGDRLLGMFGLAFWILTVQRAALTMLGENHESTTFLYVIRLAAFVLILAAIIDKNRAVAPTQVKSAHCEDGAPGI